MMKQIPVIAIDGPSASGKGTVAQLVAKSLGFHYLDSGALYRLIALKATQLNIAITDQILLATIAKNLNIEFKNQEIYLDDCIVTQDIRAEQCGILASQLAAYPQVREALTERQRKILPTARIGCRWTRYGLDYFSARIIKGFSHRQC